MDEKTNWKTNIWMIGGAIGLLAGLATAYLVIRRAEEAQQQPQLTTSDGMKIGMSVAGVIKLVSETFTRK